VLARGSGIERANDTFSSGLVQDAGVDHRGVHVLAPEKLPNRPNIISLLQQSREGAPEAMAADRPSNAGVPHRLVDAAHGASPSYSRTAFYDGKKASASPAIGL